MNFPEHITLKQVLSHNPCFSGLVEALGELNWKLPVVDQTELLHSYEEMYGLEEYDRQQLKETMRSIRSKPSSSYPTKKLIQACLSGTFNYVGWAARILGFNDMDVSIPLETQLELAYLRSEVARLTRASKKVSKAA